MNKEKDKDQGNSRNNLEVGTGLIGAVSNELRRHHNLPKSCMEYGVEGDIPGVLRVSVGLCVPSLALRLLFLNLLLLAMD